MSKNIAGSTCDKCGAELVMGDTTPCLCQAPKEVKPSVKVEGRGK